MSEKLLKRTAEEVETTQGRFLVGAKMGEGNESEDTDMRVAYRKLNRNFIEIAEELSTLPHRLGIVIYGARDEGFDVKVRLNGKVDIAESTELMERFETARLELAWLQGYNDTVNLILGEQKNV